MQRMALNPLMTLSVIFLILLLARSSLALSTLHYNITEQLPTGSRVGDVINDSQLAARYSPTDLARMRFHFRHVAGQSRESRDLFRVDEKTGEIWTNDVIDRDVMCAAMTSCSVSFDVTVRPVELFQIVRVVVEIMDLNDNSPQFSVDRIAVNILETAGVGSEFMLPAAEDADSGVNAVHEYQLMAANKQQNIDSVFQLKVARQSDGSRDVSLVLVGGLDREAISSYRLVVIATDGGNPPRAATLQVDVTVTDANDNALSFSQASYVVEVAEDHPAGSTLIQLEATDPDDGVNARVSYSLAGHSQTALGHLFGIHSHTGQVFLRQQLDYEQEQQYQLSISASDEGPGSLPVFTKLLVRVTDVNDNNPVITVNTLTGSRDAKVREHVDQSGSFVAHVAVSDRDSGLNGETRCHLPSGVTDNNLFLLQPLADKAEYQLLTAAVFDAETRDHYDVTVTCSDRGQPVLSSDVIISVTIDDINDHAPHINHPTIIELSLAENNAPRTVLMHVNATDGDSGKNQQLHYSLMPLDDDDVIGLLYIDPLVGVLSTNVTFDYEMGPNELWFVLTVHDSGMPSLSATATIHLSITDTNDEIPVFDRHVYHITVPEDTPLGTSIGRVLATDADVTASMRHVRYRLATPSNVFQVEPASGVIRLIGRLDRETAENFIVSVEAGEEGAWPSRCQLTITVADVNDNKPVFSSSATVELRLSANQQVRGALVTRLVARDIDSGENSEVSYSIVHGNEHSDFHIDALTGVITVATNTLDKTTYRLVVKATDHGTPSLSDVTDIDISVVTSSVAAAVALLDSGLVIIVGGLVAGVLLVTCCITLAIVCFRRHSKKHKYTATAQHELPRPPSQGPPSIGPPSMQLDIDPVDSHFEDSRSLSAFYSKGDSHSLRDTCSIIHSPSSSQRCRHCNVTGPPDVTALHGAATYMLDDCELHHLMELTGNKPPNFNQLMTSSASRGMMMTTRQCCCDVRPRPPPGRRYRGRGQTSASSCASTHSSSSAASSRAPSPRNPRQTSAELRRLPDMLKVLTSRDCDVTTNVNNARQLSVDVSESEVASTDSGRGLSCQGHEDSSRSNKARTAVPVLFTSDPANFPAPVV